MQPTSSSKKITFIDLFAGIGGFHLAFQSLGCRCVYASEWDKYARETYELNFKEDSPELFANDLFTGDITLKENKEKIPNGFDILCGGFPCQPFSQAGFKRGFEETRGTLFFDIAEIIKQRRPKAFFLENVRNLEKHDDGKTIKLIENTLRSLDYSFSYKLVRASDFGLPTHRPRIYMIGLHKSVVGDIENYDFPFPEPVPLKMTMSDVFEAPCSRDIGFTLRVGGKGSGLHDRRNWDSYLVNEKEKRITSKEGKKMMGFPQSFTFPVSESQAMKQLGNSVAVNALQAVGSVLVEELKREHVMPPLEKDDLVGENAPKELVIHV